MSKLDLSKKDYEADEFQSEIDVMPINSRIGFFEAGIKLSEIKQNLLSRAKEDFGTLKGVYYKIRKFNGGHAYEMHHGCDKGVLTELLANVDSKDYLLKTNDASYKVYMKQNGHISTLRLRDGDPNIDSFDKLVPRDTISPISSSGYPFFVFGIIMSVIGLVSSLSATTVKHLVINEGESIEHKMIEKEVPVDYLDDIKRWASRVDTDREYLLSVVYNSEAKKKWTQKRGFAESETEQTKYSSTEMKDKVSPEDKGKKPEVSNEGEK